MGKWVSGSLTVAYVWLLALTVLAWILTWLYLRVSERASSRSRRGSPSARPGSAGVASRDRIEPASAPAREPERPAPAGAS
jgi:hypothetical protein